MNATTQRLCVWCGPISIVVFFFGLVLAGLLPPPSPSMDAAKIALLYETHPFRTRMGIFLALIAGSGLYYPFVSAVFVQIRRIERPAAPLSYTFLTAASAFGLLFGLVFIGMATAAYRPGHRSAENVQLLNDVSWLALVGVAAPAVVSAAALGGCILCDRSAAPVFRRWVGWFNLWLALLFFPGTLAIFFQDGPFAWNGLLAFWVPAIVFTAWFFVMVRPLLDAIAQQEHAHADFDENMIVPDSPDQSGVRP